MPLAVVEVLIFRIGMSQPSLRYFSFKFISDFSPTRAWPAAVSTMPSGSLLDESSNA